MSKGEYNVQLNGALLPCKVLVILSFYYTGISQVGGAPLQEHGGEVAAATVKVADPRLNVWPARFTASKRAP